MVDFNEWLQDLSQEYSHWSPTKMSEYKPSWPKYILERIAWEFPHIYYLIPTKLENIPRHVQDAGPLIDWLESKWETPMSIPGLIHLTGYLPAAEQEMFIQSIDRHPWHDQLRRRVQQYGYLYDYKSKSITSKSYLGPLPDWLRALGTAIIENAGLKTQEFDQCIINEYMPGQGIGQHADSPGFGPEIACLSLGSPTTVQFRPWYNAPRSFPVPVSGGDLYIMTGAARSPWTHEILPTSTLGRRISVTFRTVLKHS